MLGVLALSYLLGVRPVIILIQIVVLAGAGAFILSRPGGPPDEA